MESPYTASERSVSTLSASSLEDSATTALNLSRPSASPEVGVSHVFFKMLNKSRFQGAPDALFIVKCNVFHSLQCFSFTRSL